MTSDRPERKPRVLTQLSGMPEKTTRHKILQYLDQNRTGTAREVARAMRVTPANIRRHLSILEADGRIERIGRKQIGRGRPEKVYSLSGKLKGENLEVLVRALLDEVPSARRGTLMQKIGRSGLGKAIEATQLTLRQRMPSVVDRLNELSYHARWEAGKEGPRILFGHCPYRSIVSDYPELCGMDVTLLERLSESRVDQIAKLDQKLGGTPLCIFVLREVLSGVGEENQAN